MSTAHNPQKNFSFELVGFSVRTYRIYPNISGASSVPTKRRSLGLVRTGGTAIPIIPLRSQLSLVPFPTHASDISDRRALSSHSFRPVHASERVGAAIDGQLDLVDAQKSSEKPFSIFGPRCLSSRPAGRIRLLLG
jgi:hypothetical protein